MTRLWFVVGQLRVLVGLPAQSYLFRRIRLTTACDIELARWKRTMRDSATASVTMLRRYYDHLDCGGFGIDFLLAEFPHLREPPPRRPVVCSPELYRMLKARSGASLRPARRSAP